MRLLFNGSGVRESEIELTTCELKDLSFALNELLEGFSHGQRMADYGCVLIKILDDEVNQKNSL